VRRPATRRAKPRKTSAQSAQPASTPDGGPADPVLAEDPISFSDLSLHQLFEQQASVMLDRADIDEEHKQAILVAMSCPCCGTGGMSFSVKLRKP
jgi:hypothetical protein